ncbi:MAG: class II aldolase/adducin family protein [Oscillospiraceae bacterium]|nr:class II aldolase/adducin family protein [Oscillospiraceae bacterium]
MRLAGAREQILQAAGRLVAEGLIERTWGNISARVSEAEFLITPSGLAYETLRADQLVLVNIADGFWEGPVKPSSEKGIHADAYRLRPEVNFVIHTHQYWASIAGVEGRALTGFIHPLLGKRVPCAGYGLPGTGQLRQAVASEVEAWPDCRAFLMRRHGALCLGQDMEDAFAAARALEDVCEARVRAAVDRKLDAPTPPDCGSSERRGDAFLLTLNGERRSFHIGARYLPPEAALHADIYRTGNFQYVASETAPEVVAVSNGGPVLRPYLDDLAQIAGAVVRCVPARSRPVVLAMAGRNAVLLRGAGALCAGGVASDVEAVRSLLRKGCMARLYAEGIPNCRPLGTVDAKLQRLVYLQSYKRRSQC